MTTGAFFNCFGVPETGDAGVEPTTSGFGGLHSILMS